MKTIKANKYQGLLDIPKMDEGGKPRPGSSKAARAKGKRSISRKKEQAIRSRQEAPIESLLRRIAMRKEIEEGESKGDSMDIGDVDFGDGTQGESCKVVDGKVQCASYGTSKEDLSEMATEDEKGERKPFSLVLADLIKGIREGRQESLKRRMKRVGPRREIDLDPDPAREFAVRNPFARARYRSLQKRLARSKGREDAGSNVQFVESPEF
jgi:hypothetical protein